MGDVGAPAPPRLAVLFERAREVVEIAGQLAELIAAAVADPASIVALGQGARAGGQFAHRIEQPAGQGEGQQQGHGEDRHAGDQGVPELVAGERKIGIATQLRQPTQVERADRLAIDLDRQARRTAGDRGITDHGQAARIDQKQARKQVQLGQMGAPGAFRTVPRRWRPSPVVPARRRWFVLGPGRIGWRSMPRHALAAAQIGLDQVGECARIAAQEAPAAVFGIGTRQALADRLQALERDFVEIAEKSLAKRLLLPDHEGGQGQTAQRGKGQEQTLPETQVHRGVVRGGMDTR